MIDPQQIKNRETILKAENLGPLYYIAELQLRTEAKGSEKTFDEWWDSGGMMLVYENKTLKDFARAVWKAKK